MSGSSFKSVFSVRRTVKRALRAARALKRAMTFRASKSKQYVMGNFWSCPFPASVQPENGSGRYWQAKFTAIKAVFVKGQTCKQVARLPISGRIYHVLPNGQWVRA